MQQFIEIFKNFCVAIVLIEIFGTFAAVALVLISDRLSGADKQEGQGIRAGNHTLCALNNRPCMYAEGSESACDGCPVAQEYFYKQEAKEEVEGRFSEVQDEGSAD